MIFLIIINIISIFGYATFVLNPELLARFSWAPPIFAVSFPLFAQIQIFAGFLVMAVKCHKDLKNSWHFYFLVSVIISFIMEYGGTTYGIPFGKYSYSSLLGWKLFGQVPLLIPLSWFFMAIPCYLIADQILGEKKWFFARTFLGSFLLITWDLTLDPAMSHLTSFWVWEEPASQYLNMPVKNLMGWMLTGVLILGAFELKGLKMPSSWKSDQFPLKFYAVNLMLPVGFSIAGQLWFSVAATMVVFLLCVLLSQKTGGIHNFWKTENQ